MTRKEWEAWWIHLEHRAANAGMRRRGLAAENTMARILRAYGLEVQDAHVIATQAGR